MSAPRPLQVLVVDDDFEFLGVVRALLELEGHPNWVYERPADALDHVSENVPDLLLTDVAMPEIPGPELVRRVLAVRPSMKVLYMSAYSFDEAVDEFGLPRNAPFLPKPFTRQGLARAIAALLAED